MKQNKNEDIIKMFQQCLGSFSSRVERPLSNYRLSKEILRICIIYLTVSLIPCDILESVFTSGFSSNFLF